MKPLWDLLEEKLYTGMSKLVGNSLAVFLFRRSYMRYLHTGARRKLHHRLLRDAATATNGAVLDWAADVVLDQHVNDSVGKAQNALGSPHTSARLRLIEKGASAIEEFGWWLAPYKVNRNLLASFGKEVEEYFFQAHNVNLGDFSDSSDLADSLGLPEMLNLPDSLTWNSQLATSLVAQDDLWSVASAYLGRTPVLWGVNAWLSFSKKQVKSGSAQNWHFDLDRVKWLVVFINVTRVTESNGPHSFVVGSHRDTWKIQSKNSRFTDDDVKVHYEGHDVKTFVVDEGSVLFEDTRGLHRGTPVQCGYRLMFELQFAINDYGKLLPPVQINQPDVRRKEVLVSLNTRATLD